MYADLGPLSFERQAHFLAGTIDDTRITYAQVNIHPLKVKDMQLDKSTGHLSAGINNNIIITVLNCNMNTCFADDSLNLDFLLMQIKREITQHWYQFGKALGVESKVLEKCSQHPPEESIVEVCDHWLRNHTGKPTWREVAEALRQIKFQSLAFDIENVYKTGISVHIELDSCYTSHNFHNISTQNEQK